MNLEWGVRTLLNRFFDGHHLAATQPEQRVVALTERPKP